jgi:hypothetical protein
MGAKVLQNAPLSMLARRIWKRTTGRNSIEMLVEVLQDSQ